MLVRSMLHQPSSPRRRARRLAGIAAAVVLAAGACGGSDGSNASEEGAPASQDGTVAAQTSAAAPAANAPAPGGNLTVVVTTTQLADFARQIGGDRITVVSLAKPGADLHDFEPGPAELEDLRGADLVVRNGLGLDPWLDDALKAAEVDAPVVDASAGITPRDAGGGHEDDHAGEEAHAGEEDHDHDHAGEKESAEKAPAEKESAHSHEHGDTDPHMWFDPRNAVQMVTTIAEALTDADPQGGAAYTAALERYRGEIEKLDRDIEAAVATLTNRKLVTNHEAFGYFVDRYGLDFVGSIIPSFDSTAELSAADVTELVAKIKSEGVVAVFSEASIPPKTAEAIARDAGVKIIGGKDALYGDALGPAGSPGETYLGMMRHNARVIVEALGGTGPRA